MVGDVAAEGLLVMLTVDGTDICEPVVSMLEVVPCEISDRNQGGMDKGDPIVTATGDVDGAGREGITPGRLKPGMVRPGMDTLGGQEREGALVPMWGVVMVIAGMVVATGDVGSR